MKTFQTYYTKQALSFFVLALVMLLIIYFAVDFISNYRAFGADFGEAFGNYVLKIPEMIYQMQAISLFLANVVVLSMIFSRNEYVVMTTSGVGLLRVYAPVVLMTFVISAGFTYVYDYTQAPLARIREMRDVHGLRVRDYQVDFADARVWYRFPGAMVRIGAVYPDSGAFDDIQFYLMAPDFSLNKWISAKHAVVRDQQWHFSEFLEIVYQDDGALVSRELDRVTMELPYTMDDFQKIQTNPELLRFDHIAAGLMADRFRPSEAHRYQTALLERLLYVFVPLILLFLGAPLVTVYKRNYSLLFNVGLTFFLSISFWTGHQIFTTMGYVGKLPPVLAVFAIPVIFMGVGSVLWFRRG